jgi:hypothetical protein
MKSKTLIARAAIEESRRIIGNSPVTQTAVKLDQLLRQGGFSYAMAGGYAVQQYGYVRYTQDVDVVVPTRAKVRDFLIASKQLAPVRGKDFIVKDRETGVPVDLLPAGPVLSYMPTPRAPKARGVQFVTLPELVSMKLASQRMKDRADVTELVKANGLGEDFANELPPGDAADYLSILKQARREIATALKD